MLYLDEPFIVWADFPIQRFEDHVDVEKKVTSREYYAGPVKKRQYHYLQLTARCKDINNHYRPTHTFNLGLTQAMQIRKLDVDQSPWVWEEMKNYGLKAKIYHWDNFEAEVLCLELDNALVQRPSIRDKLVDWLNMDPCERPIKTIE